MRGMGRTLALLCAVALAGQPTAGRYLASAMAAQHIPALSYAVVRNGVVVTSGTRGLANVELNAPATDATEFAIASMSKSISASAVVLLAQDGKLSIDDRVSRYLPDVPETWKDMTIRHLLSHTSGVKDHFHDSAEFEPLTTLDRRLAYSDAEYLKAHLDAPLNFAPGTKWAYSGGGYVILGAIIAKVTGRPYGDYLRDRIFTPLGMQHTHLISVADLIPHRASGYWFRNGHLRNGGYSGQAHISGPDVGVMTTAADMAKWMAAVASARLWTTESRDAMWTPTTLSDGRQTVSFPAAIGYGLGWTIGTYRGYKMVGHGGTLVNGFTSTFFMLPEKQLGVVVLTNQYDATPQAIAFGIAGRYDAELRSASDASPQPDPDPAGSARANAFFDALLSGGDLSQLATPGLVKHLSAMWHPPARPAGPPASFVFVGREDVKRPLQRFGSDVVRFAYYKVHVDGDDHSFTLLLSSDGRIAGYEAY